MGIAGELYVEGQLVGNDQATGGFRSLNVIGTVYLGGLPDSVANPPSDQLKIGLVGCIRGLIMDSIEVDLVEDATGGVNVESCTTALCSSHSDCQNGGTCQTGGDSSMCVCAYGYIGDKCELGELLVHS